MDAVSSEVKNASVQGVYVRLLAASFRDHTFLFYTISRLPLKTAWEVVVAVLSRVFAPVLYHDAHPPENSFANTSSSMMTGRSAATI